MGHHTNCHTTDNDGPTKLYAVNDIMKLRGYRDQACEEHSAFQMLIVYSPVFAYRRGNSFGVYVQNSFLAQHNCNGFFDATLNSLSVVFARSSLR